jgi:outer membrane protein OmpA-like peptidoglycan-associated protein
MLRGILLSTVLLFYITPDLAQQQMGGLKGEYFNGIDFNFPILTRVDEKIGFSRRLESPAPGVGKEFFSIRWSGAITAPVSGKYAFHVLADDGVRVWVNHQLVIDAWYEQEATAYSGQIILEKDQSYDILIEYFNTVIHSVIDVKWEMPPEVVESFGHRFHLDVERKEEIPFSLLKPVRQVAKPKASLVVRTDIGRSDSTATIALRDDTQPVIVKKVSTQRKPVVVKRTGEFIPDEPIVLNTVVFEQQRADIPNGAFEELNRVVAYLRKYPSKKIEIMGHTDYAGDSTDNQLLSEQRARAVAAYLRSAGIETDRIRDAGFGGRYPIISGERIEDRLVNRRVEFVIRD